ncbi:hypothetical protein [Microbispora triticiradicis]|uniref:PQQ-binding-like beta-propeller repeat protein n=2 Tax=Microbispora TaxID=2005 RepID=A0ABY3M3L4_9ACTN|nr:MULTISPECIES: hypothetical protein [Microbispora]TLP56270.1 hypothetical protein FED44_23380 [Microbispora fusca]TYB65640.1 hypothetical protein FXF59_06070 [Microbispora tritici]
MIRRLAAVAVLGVAMTGCAGDGAVDAPASPGSPAAAGPRPGPGPSLGTGVWTETPIGAAVERVAATADGEVWAVGGTGEAGRGSLARWDGRAWRRMRLPAGLPYLNAVSGTSSRDVWLFDKDADVRRWDGRRWSAGSRTGHRRAGPPCPRPGRAGP